MMTGHVCTLAVLLGVFVCATVSGEKHTVGTYFQSESAYPGPFPSIFLFQSAALGRGSVTEFSTYAVATAPVWLQVWRPNNGGRHTLVGQVLLDPQAVGEKYEVSLSPDQYIATQEGDVLGMYCGGEACPVAYRFNAQNAAPLLYHIPQVGTRPSIGDVLLMQEITMPYEFAITVTYDTDLIQTPSPGVTPTSFPSTPQPTTQPVVEFPNIPPSVGSLEYAGNGLRGKDFHIQQSARGMYLLPHVKLPKAVIVSFFAYFVRSEPVCFQVLRLHSGEDTFELVGQVCHTPQRAPGMEEVKLGASEYIFTEQGDQLGYLNLEYTGSIGYTFLLNPFEQRLGPWSTGYGGSLPQPWDRITFDQSWLPYDFAIGARYDTVIDHSKYGYPPMRPTRPSTLPTHSSTHTSHTGPTTTTTTPAPTRTSPTTTTAARSRPTRPDITEKIIGLDYLQRAEQSLESGAERTFLLRDLCFPAPGILTSFLFFPVAAGTIELQVWRPYTEDSSTTPSPGTPLTRYQLIGHKRVAVSSFREFQQVTLGGAEQIEIRQGDCLGFSTLGDRGVIGYSFQEVRLSYASEYDGLETGAILVFDSIMIPYKYSVAATYKDLPTEPDTTARVPEPPTTPRPAATTTTTQGPQTGAVSGSELGPAWLYDRRFLLAVLVWLVVLTVLFLALCCYVACCRGKQQQKAIKEAQRGSYLYGYHDLLRHNSVNSTNSRYGQMRANEVINYFNPTIGSHPGIRRDDSMKKPLTREDSGASSYNGGAEGGVMSGSGGRGGGSPGSNGVVLVTEAEVREGPYTVL